MYPETVFLKTAPTEVPSMWIAETAVIPLGRYQSDRLASGTSPYER